MTKGRDQAGRFMSIPTDCEVAPPDSSVVQNVVMNNPFATTLVVFADGSGFGTAMSNGIPGFGPGLKYEVSWLPSLLSYGGGKRATAIGHAKVFLRCTGAEEEQEEDALAKQLYSVIVSDSFLGHIPDVILFSFAAIGFCTTLIHVFRFICKKNRQEYSEVEEF